MLRDLSRLQKIGKRTFFDTYAAGNSEENMRQYLENVFSDEKVQSELTDENSEFYFAELDEEEIGYLKVNLGPSQTDLKVDNALEIERIYVLKEYQGLKVGQKLLTKATEIAKQKQLDYVWLGVWERNPNAIQFYQKHGFTEFDKHVFKLGDDEQTDLMMKLEIR